MTQPSSLRLRLPGTDLSVGIDLATEQNPDTCAAVLETMPLESIVGHVVVSGGGMWIPTRKIYVGPRVSVQRRPGSVYFYPPMQSICITYGDVLESAFVNEFARVREEDLETLNHIGKHIWDTTIVDPHRKTVRVSIESEATK